MVTALKFFHGPLKKSKKPAVNRAPKKTTAKSSHKATAVKSHVKPIENTDDGEEEVDELEPSDEEDEDNEPIHPKEKQKTDRNVLPDIEATVYINVVIPAPPMLFNFVLKKLRSLQLSSSDNDLLFSLPWIYLMINLWTKLLAQLLAIVKHCEG